MDSPTEPTTLASPRAVPLERAFAWFTWAMVLFKRAPARWCGLAAITLGVELGLQLVPGAGVALSKILVPVIACGLLLGADALDRGEPLRMRFAVDAFAAPAGPLAAIIVAELMVFAAEWIAAYALDGVDLLATGDDAANVSPFLLMEIFGAGMLVSLPLLFVPFAALFEHASFAEAFAKSWRGFVVNQGVLLIYGLVSLVLVGLGLMTLGIGLVIAIPLISVASYAAWKDIFGDSREKPGSDA